MAYKHRDINLIAIAKLVLFMRNNAPSFYHRNNATN